MSGAVEQKYRPQHSIHPPPRKMRRRFPPDYAISLIDAAIDIALRSTLTILDGSRHQIERDRAGYARPICGRQISPDRRFGRWMPRGC